MHSEIIAELEINHGKSVSVAKQLMYAAKEVGASTIKLQAFNAKEFTTPASQYREIFEGVELSNEEFKELKEYAAEIEVGFLLTIADLTSTKLIRELNLKRVKIGSTNITNQILLKRIAETNCDVILSTGASNLDEVEAVKILKITVRNKSHSCIAQYHPCEPQNVNINGMIELKNNFPGLNVGYSDHTIGNNAAVIAIARLQLKNTLLSEYMDGPDHKFCTNPTKFKEFIENIREAEAIMGSKEKRPISVESRARVTGRRYNL